MFPQIPRLSSLLLFAILFTNALALTITSSRYTGTYITSTEDYSHLVINYSYKKTDASKFSIYIYDTHSKKSTQVVKTVKKKSGTGSAVQYVNAYITPGTYSVKFTKYNDPSHVYSTSKTTFTVKRCGNIHVTKTLYAGTYANCGNTAVAGASWSHKSCSPTSLVAYLYSTKTKTQKFMPGPKLITKDGHWEHCLFKKEMEGPGTYKVHIYANVTNPTKSPLLATTAEWTISEADWKRLIVNGDGWNDA